MEILVRKKPQVTAAWRGTEEEGRTGGLWGIPQGRLLIGKVIQAWDFRGHDEISEKNKP